MQRGTSASSSVRSVGLGLFIVREIARAHGGAVGARSEAGVTTFAVRLPRAHRDAPGESGDGASAPPEA